MTNKGPQFLIIIIFIIFLVSNFCGMGLSFLFWINLTHIDVISSGYSDTYNYLPRYLLFFKLFRFCWSQIFFYGFLFWRPLIWKVFSFQVLNPNTYLARIFIFLPHCFLLYSKYPPLYAINRWGEVPVTPTLILRVLFFLLYCSWRKWSLLQDSAVIIFNIGLFSEIFA